MSQGPSLTIDTACSSSLVATHAARWTVTQRESESAIAAGINLILAPSASIRAAVVGITSVGGRCFVFDSRADGYARAEACGAALVAGGVGAVVLVCLDSDFMLWLCIDPPTPPRRSSRSITFGHYFA